MIEIFDSQLVGLVKQWCNCLDYEKSQKIVRNIALQTGCLNPVPTVLSDDERREVLQWVNRNYPTVYLAVTGRVS